MRFLLWPCAFGLAYQQHSAAIDHAAIGTSRRISPTKYKATFKSAEESTSVCSDSQPCDLRYADCVDAADDHGKPSFECVCHKGYELTVRGKCEAVNLCPGACNTDISTCTQFETQTHGQDYRCDCIEGYFNSVDDNKSCLVKDLCPGKCDIKTSDCIQSEAEDHKQIYTCKCKEGFEPSDSDQFTCSEINLCPGECDERRSTCVQYEDAQNRKAYRCDCHDHFEHSDTSDDKSCTRESPT